MTDVNIIFISSEFLYFPVILGYRDYPYRLSLFSCCFSNAIVWRKSVCKHLGASQHTVQQYLPYQHTEAETKWAPFRRRHFQIHVL